MLPSKSEIIIRGAGGNNERFVQITTAAMAADEPTTISKTHTHSRIKERAPARPPSLRISLRMKKRKKNGHFSLFFFFFTFVHVLPLSGSPARPRKLPPKRRLSSRVVPPRFGRQPKKVCSRWSAGGNAKIKPNATQPNPKVAHF